jgi:hypothetical protein
VLDESSFPDEHNLGEKLLPAIDKLLKRNKIIVEEVKRMALKSDISDNFTTRRMAEAVSRTFNWHLTNFSK